MKNKQLKYLKQRNIQKKQSHNISISLYSNDRLWRVMKQIAAEEGLKSANILTKYVLEDFVEQYIQQQTKGGIVK